MSRRQRSFLPGFTLVELLVVVAIIALLLSILLPSLAKAREQAKKARCLANLKDIGGASVVYATDDESDILIPGPRKKGVPAGGFLWFWGAQHFGGKGGNKDLNLGTQGWKHAWTAFERFGPGDRPLNQILFKNPTYESWYSANAAGRPYTADDDRLESQSRLDMDVFHCPSDTGLQANTGALNPQWAAGGFGALAESQILPDTSFYDIMGNSYATHWLTPLITDGGGYPYYGWGAFNRQITSVPNASRCVIYREGNSWDTEFYNSIDGGLNVPSQNLKIDAWHGSAMAFTAGFADGHAGTITHLVRTNVIGIDPYGLEATTSDYQLRGSRAEEVQLPESIDFGGSVGSAFVLIRGNGWQMDFFPAPWTIVLADSSDLTGD